MEVISLIVPMQRPEFKIVHLKESPAEAFRVSCKCEMIFGSVMIPSSDFKMSEFMHD